MIKRKLPWWGLVWALVGVILPLSAETVPAQEIPPLGPPLAQPAAARPAPSAEVNADNPPGIPNQAEVAATAARMGVSPAALQAGVDGLAMIYSRRYEQAISHFSRLTSDYPTEALGPFGTVLLYQSWMMENFDFAYEPQWRVASEEGLRRTEKALRQGRAKAWNEFIKGSLQGIEGIYAIRHGSYPTALSHALKALKSMERSLELDPEFHDAELGVGLYNYWRTVITERVWYLPDFGDHRAVGMAQVERARTQGIFTQPGARLALAYTFYEEKRIDEAKAQCLELRRLYPDNILNNMMLGRIALRQGKVRDAKRYLADVKRVDPSNWLVLYYEGMIAMREQHWIEARDAFKSYLEHKGDPTNEGYALLRLGDCYWQLNLDGAARDTWKESAARDNKTAEKRLKGEVPKRKGQVQIYVRSQTETPPPVPEAEEPAPPSEGEEMGEREI